MIQLDALAVSTVHVVSQRVSNSWSWYIIRAAGFTAAFLLVLLVISGIGQVTGLTYRLIEPLKAWVIHKALAIALCVSIAIHVSFLLIDHYVSFSLTQLLIPFTSHYSNNTHFLGLPLSSLAISMGVLAMYGIAIIVLSSLYWMDSKKKMWRWLHYLSYAVAILIFLHAMYAGSDLKYGTFRTIWILIGATVFIAAVLRLFRAGTLKK